MIEIVQTGEFRNWLKKLADRRASEVIAQRLVRLQSGLLGDAKFFEGIGELRIHVGPGYRLYFVRKGEALVILLCGGSKGTQRKDIDRAKQLAEEV